MPIKKPQFKKGDTLIEVSFAIAVFCLVSIISVGIMDRDLSTIQGTLELEMARNEIDAQAEALRFIHNSFLSEREYKETEQVYRKLWKKLTASIDVTEYDEEDGSLIQGFANNPEDMAPFTASQCSAYYENSGEHSIFDDKAFVINTRNVDPYSIDTTIIPAVPETGIFEETKLYPRIIFSTDTGDADTESSDTDLAETLPDGTSITMPVYNKVAKAEGLWTIATKDITDSGDTRLGPLSSRRPEFFDFHIRTCWYPPNSDYPATIATIIRLYNPEVIREAAGND